MGYLATFAAGVVVGLLLWPVGFGIWMLYDYARKGSSIG